METKEEISERLNKKLQTDIEWHRLRKEDLKHFEHLIDEGLIVKPLAEEMIKRESKKKLDDAVDNWEFGKLLREMV